jgi:hypothetical protein
MGAPARTLSMGNAAGAVDGVSWTAGGIGPAQPASIPTMAAVQRKRFMLLILLEALLALLLFVLIVWWTMFAGRHKGELRRDEGQPDGDDR